MVARPPACPPARLPADDDFDYEREKAGGGEDAELAPDAEPPEWDIDAPLQPAPFNVMMTCYTLFERDRCARSAVAVWWRWVRVLEAGAFG